MKITRFKAEKSNCIDLYGYYILEAITKIWKQAFENYEALNGPTMLINMTDEKLGIDDLVSDLMTIYSNKK